MRRWNRHAEWWVIAPLWILLSGCGGNVTQSTSPIPPYEIAFTSDGAVVRSGPDRVIRRVVVRDGDETVLLDTGPSQASSLTRRIGFTWEEGQNYIFELEGGGGEALQTTLESPAKASFRSRLSLSLPYVENAGLTPGEGTDTLEVAVIADTTTSLALIVRNSSNAPLSGRVVLTLPSDLHPTVTDGTAQEAYSIHLNRHGETWLKQIPLSFSGPSHGPWDIVAVAQWRQAGAVWEDTERIRAIHREPAELLSVLIWGETRFPCDSFGRVQNERRPDAFVLPATSFQWLRSLLGLADTVSNRWVPMGFDRLELVNSGTASMSLLVEEQVVNVNTGKPVPEMSPPELLSGGNEGSLGFMTIAPGTAENVSVPLYIDLLRVLPGTYQRQIRIKPWGTDVTLKEFRRPLEVVRPSPVAFLVVLYAIGAALLLVVVAARRGAKYLARYQTRELVTVALFATVLFAAVTLPMSVLANIATAFLGPFAFLATGLVNEVVYYALLIAFLTLVPRVGALTVLIGVRVLLSATILGQVTAPGLLYTASHVLLLESACRLSGLTRNRTAPGTPQSALQRLARGQTVSLWWPALCLGAADAISSWVDFQLTIELYRLYFADWYVMLSILVHGFIYTLIGVRLGVHVGRSLGRTAP